MTPTIAVTFQKINKDFGKKIKNMLESSNINFLFGSGLSQPFMPTLNNIEQNLNQAKDIKERVIVCKKYLKDVMLPNKRIINNSLSKTKTNNKSSEFEKFTETITQYKVFFMLLGNILFERKNTITSKQANIFTTNIDIFIELALEMSGLEYNDGFTGYLEPKFSSSNFKKTIHKRSLHFENISEVPTFNVIKVHGSLTWKIGDDDKKITYSKLDHFDETLLEMNDADFEEKYKKILIVNPEQEKLRKAVLDVIYYESLRQYSSELEKENTTLFVMGFSMNDEHIKQITLRSANTNPTLSVFVFCHSKKTVDEMGEKFKDAKYHNIIIIEPEDDSTLQEFNFKKINLEFGKIIKDEESQELE